ncbi:serine/threonine-protein kinase [Nocardia heshunensis]
MLNSGDVFAGFTIERLLGQGGMGSVYLARHPRLGKLTALKLLNRELYADREIRARFEREADLVARLDHPNIVEVYDRGTESDMLWISMQYVDGVDAAGINVATLPPERAVQVIEGVASALDYAHGMGVLHRDVKPANIILARAVAGHGERVFLTDFGIARLREDSTHLTQAGMFTATLAYASPEQMTGAPLDPTTDQYSLACALYWLLIGAGPYDSPHPAELIRGHLQLLPPPVSMRRPGLSPAMDAVLTKAMAKRPVDRFPTCVAFAKAARAALSGPPAQHPVHQRPTYPNPASPQPYPAQPYPAPAAYPPPPQGYPAVPPQQPAGPPQQPAAYPAPPQPAVVPVPQPNPIPAPNYPVPQPQSATPPAQPPAGYPAPSQPAAPGWVPQHAEQVTERVSSGPTVRPNPVDAPTVDPSQRPTDVVAQPVIPGDPQEDMAGQGNGLPESPGFDELVAEPSTALTPPGASTADTEPNDGDESSEVPVGVDNGAEPESAGPQGQSGAVTRHPDSGAFVPTSGSGGGGATAGTGGDAGSDVLEEVSAATSESTADVTAASAPTAAPETTGGSDASVGFGATGNGGSHAAGVVVAGGPGAGGEPGFGMYGGVAPGAPAAPGGPGYGVPPEQFGVNPVRPGLVPTSQRAEASQLTALLVLGLAVVALVLLVVVAVVVVSG